MILFTNRIRPPKYYYPLECQRQIVFILDNDYGYTSDSLVPLSFVFRCIVGVHQCALERQMFKCYVPADVCIEIRKCKIKSFVSVCWCVSVCVCLSGYAYICISNEAEAKAEGGEVVVWLVGCVYPNDKCNWIGIWKCVQNWKPNSHVLATSPLLSVTLCALCDINSISPDWQQMLLSLTFMHSFIRSFIHSLIHL